MVHELELDVVPVTVYDGPRRQKLCAECALLNGRVACGGWRCTITRFLELYADLHTSVDWHVAGIVFGAEDGRRTKRGATTPCALMGDLRHYPKAPEQRRLCQPTPCVCARCRVGVFSLAYPSVFQGAIRSSSAALYLTPGDSHLACASVSWRS